MTKVLLSRSAQAIGVPLTVRAWRQLAVGIAVRKFAGQRYELDLATDGHAGTERDGHTGGVGSSASMPEALYWQASHAPRTGNSVYGGTVNFKAGLTDAGLQEYLRASQI
ncbi:hypothetical protein EJ08DRAFT_201580 [Tothia fuscella]|uniref:Uncharacterized protein n=1 Tax=Tothia fuscella TaxID=1048955 RepID=A0A9P4NDR4_9PEZI|nr:hypothetical protein EJ08DRAFT_201580 [Tothia fuscella]